MLLNVTDEKVFTILYLSFDKQIKCVSFLSSVLIRLYIIVWSVRTISFLRDRPSMQHYMTSMNVVPLLIRLFKGISTSPMHPQMGSLAWLLAQRYANLTHVSTDELRGVSTPVCLIGVHGSAHTIQCKSKKYASSVSSMLVHPWCDV